MNAADDLDLGLGLLREDPQYHRIPEAERGPLVAMALAEGRAHAESIAGRWGRDPAVIAARFGVPIVEDDGTRADYGTTVVFAEYFTRPARIILHRKAIRRIEALPDRQALGGATATAVFLAHELFHHVDCNGSRPSLAQRHRVTVVALWRWHLTSGLASLAEIAAGAFARELLGLPCHPRMLELALRGASGVTTGTTLPPWTSRPAAY